MNMHALVSNASVSERRPLNKRYPDAIIAKYEADLRSMIEMVETEEYVYPPVGALVKYFKDEYGMKVAESTIKDHVKKLREGNPLWA